MEELVGRWWHEALMKVTAPAPSAATVHLADMRATIGLMFRAAGGAGTARLATASLQRTADAPHWLHRLAGVGNRAALPACDADVLALPDSLSVFDDPALNHDLYLWLALLSAHWSPHADWVLGNIFATKNALSAFPGFVERYEKLITVHLRQREAHALPGRANAQAERTVRAALAGQWPADTPSSCVPADVAPVWLWVCGPTAQALAGGSQAGQTRQADSARQPTAADGQRRRTQATTHEVDRAPFVLPFRAEALMTWSEMVRVNRSTDDEDDGNAQAAANDMDALSIAPDGQTLASRVKFDLDLPSSSIDDVPLGEGQPFPEWDFKRGLLQPAHVLVQASQARVGTAFQPAPALRTIARQMRRRMEVMRHTPRLQRGQENGEEIDIDAWIRLQADNQGAHQRGSDTPAVYARHVAAHRSLATWLLADLSQSTDAFANDHMRVIDVIRDAVYVFGEALHAVGDPFAVWGFSSVRRQNVRLQKIKGMDERWDASARDRVGAIKPGFYTRMGAAIRHATHHLQHCPQRCRLLLLLTDGKPNDLDEYEGRYGLEDTRHAILEAREAGVTPFCVTIDPDGHDYLPMLFGTQGYVLVHRPQDLARRLTHAWTQLARHGGQGRYAHSAER